MRHHTASLVRVGFVGALSLGLASTGCLAELGEGEGEDGIDVQSSAIAGFVQLAYETPVDTTSVKELTANCPAGTVVYGAGHAALNAGNGVQRAELRYSAPTTGGKGWKVKARGVIRGLTSSWKLKVVITCGTKPAGYKILTADTTASTAATQVASPTCGTGKAPVQHALGGGFAALTAAGAVMDGDLVKSVASLGRWSLSVKAFLAPGTSWKARGYAICADAAAVPGHRVIFSEATYTDGQAAPTITATCASGSVAIAAGGNLISTTFADIDARTVYSVPVPGGWTSTEVRVQPRAQPSLVSQTFEQSMVCLN